MTVDPLVRQTLSTYGYAANDPLNKTDPSGKFWGIAAAVVGAVAGEAIVPFVAAVAVVVVVVVVVNDRINDYRNSGGSSGGGDSYEDSTVNNYIPPPKSLPAFPDAKPVTGKTPVKGGGGTRKRWKDKKGCIYGWDSQHGAVEKYDKSGKKHLGEFDPITGAQNKPGDKKRKVEK
ncbi:hypothetical protein GT354_42150 [Streptomyces sp. SID3343]|nr:hypothetical protein [Streptomyces sp. SID3343]